MSFSLKTNKTSYIKIPEINEIETKFVYNFFTRDEKIQPFSKQVKENNRLPRYVEINFSLNDDIEDEINFNDISFNDVLNDSKNSDLIFDESDYSSQLDENINFSDRNIDSRINKKLKMLSKILIEENFDNINEDNINNEQINNILSQKFEKKDYEEINKILKSNVDDNLIQVNNLGQIQESNIFIKASTTDISCKTDKRLTSDLITDNHKTFKFSKLELNEKIIEDNKNFISSIYNKQNIDEPNFISLDSQKVNNNIGNKTQYDIVGYRITRFEIKDGILDQNSKYQFYIDNVDNKNIIDSTVLYGKSYIYSISLIVLVKFFTKSIETKNLEAGYYKNLGLIASTPVFSKNLINTINYESPKEPDGIFYRFDFQKGEGLIINWQIPSYKGRNIKYFQIFRRFSINEPFTCIGQIDFNDSEIKNVKTEFIKNENIIKSFDKNNNGIVLTTFEDSEYTRLMGQKGPIYAICSVDAHELSSGYSNQTQVIYEPSTNKIKLKQISRNGAPKQYPNLYIDPTLDDNILSEKITQDCILLSGKNNLKIFFNPDAFAYTINNQETGEQSKRNVFYTKNGNGAFYKIHIINLDRQKQEVYHIDINDLRK